MKTADTRMRRGRAGRADEPDTAGLERLDRLAWLLDASLRVPGTDIRFGVDAVLGLVPAIGDAAALLLSAYLIGEARRQGASGAVILRMFGNVALDTALGAIPLFGDVFDVFWRANQRNLRLLRSHLERRRGR